MHNCFRVEIDVVHNFNERQYPPISALLAILLLAPAVSVLFYFLNMWVGLVIGLALSLVFIAFFWFVSPKISVSNGVLQVGRAQIPTKYLGEATIYRGHSAWEERGPKSDPNAWFGIRGGIDPVTKIVIDDRA
ncbi:MAG: DUF3093 family protein [Microbacteriaceae bacterium]|nr:DUF3093 family protein [Microbacteriaceae bacterium]